jgi:parallel beta-helix repeat protein
MKISTGKLTLGVLACAGMLSTNALADAGTHQLLCGGQRTVADALGQLNPGDTLLVSGACIENITIPEDIQDITLSGQGTASITALNSDESSVNIRGRGITLTGFTIIGGLNGVIVTRGGAAIIDANVIQTAQTGVTLSTNGTARLVNNTIQNNTGNGVAAAESAALRLDNNIVQNNGVEGVIINENSSARIGLDAPNTIQGNGGRGVVVTRSSNARITGNTIINNVSRGVDVLRGSHADVANNNINANGGHGILVNYNSAVNLDAPNTGSNGQFGIVCLNSGMVDGRRGSLTGANGQTSFANGCVNNTIP